MVEKYLSAEMERKLVSSGFEQKWITNQLLQVMSRYQVGKPDIAGYEQKWLANQLLQDIK